MNVICSRKADPKVVWLVRRCGFISTGMELAQEMETMRQCVIFKVKVKYLCRSIFRIQIINMMLNEVKSSSDSIVAEITSLLNVLQEHQPFHCLCYDSKTVFNTLSKSTAICPKMKT